MTASNDPDQIRAEIERTRSSLSYNVDNLELLSNPVDRRITRLADHLLIRRVVRPVARCGMWLRRGRGRPGVVR